MKNLTNSIFLLLAYLFSVLGLANIRYFELHVLYFQGAMLVIMTLAVFAGLVPKGRYRLPLVAFLVFWAIIYLLVWQFYWRSLASPPDLSEVVIQFLLMEVAAGLAHNVGRQLAVFDTLLENLSASIFPNRSLEISLATDRIQIEMTRSRRYNRPLSVLTLQINKNPDEKYEFQIKKLEKDLIKRLMLAKVGQIIDANARQTDLIMHNPTGEFVILCPETDTEVCTILANRISHSIEEKLGDGLKWGIASFPQDTLEFDDLLQKSRQHLQEMTHTNGMAEEKPVKSAVG